MTRLRAARLLFAMAALCLVTAAPAAGAGLVANGDFSRAGDPPAGWSRDPDVARKGRVRVSAGVLELAPNAANHTPSAKPLGLGQAIDASGLGGRTLLLSARLGLVAPARAAIVGLHALRGDGSEIGHARLSRTQAGPGLEEASDSLVLPAGERPARLILYAVVEGLGGAARFADIRVEPAPAPARAADEGPAYAARVSVDAAARGRHIPRDLYGVNVEWWRNANGLWDERRDALDPGALELAKALKPSLIRFPGGFLGDFYDWRAAVEPRRDRAPQPESPRGGAKLPPNFGTQELAGFAHAVGADLMLSVNLGTGTAALAADWVRFLQEARRRDARVPPVRYWEMGNELYHKGDASGASLAPRDYVARLRAFAREMRAVDPAIRLGAIGLENYPTFPFNSYRDWNETVLRGAGDEIDFLAVHNAYAPVGVKDDADPREVYPALWAAPLMVAENLRTVGAQIRRWAPASRAPRIGIAVTEWAPLFHVSPASAWVDHAKTLGSAVYVADVLRVFAQDERVQAANFFKLNEPSFLGLLGARHGQWTPNATYYAFELYTRHFGETLVGASARSPTYDSARVGIVPPMKGVPLLETVASLSGDGRTLFVMLINKSLDRRADVAVDLAGFEADGGTAHLLTGASPDSNTGTELPRVPGLRWGKQANLDPRRLDFDRGSPQAIAFTSRPLEASGRTLAYGLPAHSVACLELRRR